MNDKSILLSTKKLLQIPEDYDHFDIDIVTHINSVLSHLHQLGLGPKEGFAISGDGETWNEFIDDKLTLQNVKSYVYLKVRLWFDPPANAFLVSSMEKQLQEFDFRLTVAAEEIQNGK